MDNHTMTPKYYYQELKEAYILFNKKENELKENIIKNKDQVEILSISTLTNGLFKIILFDQKSQEILNPIYAVVDEEINSITCNTFNHELSDESMLDVFNYLIENSYLYKVKQNIYNISENKKIITNENLFYISINEKVYCINCLNDEVKILKRSSKKYCALSPEEYRQFLIAFNMPITYKKL